MHIGVEVDSHLFLPAVETVRVDGDNESRAKFRPGQAAAEGAAEGAAEAAAADFSFELSFEGETLLVAEVLAGKGQPPLRERLRGPPAGEFSYRRLSWRIQTRP